MGDISIATLNVDGLRADQKRDKIFQYFENSPYDIVLLQETHVQMEDIPKWKKQWKYYSIWNPGESNKTCGIGILINGHKQITVTDYSKDMNGRVINIKLQYKSQNIQIVSVYAPDKPYLRETFFKNLKTYLFDDTPIVIGGDFNMVECSTKDRKGGVPSHTHKQGIVQLQYLKQEFELEDKWRAENDQRLDYTWTSRKQHDNIHSRLDRFYISKNIQHIKTESLYNIWSDHKILNTVIKLGKPDKRGQNYWKLNTDILNDARYRAEMTTFINKQKDLKQGYENIIEWWDMTKVHIKMYTKKYCQQINQKRQKDIAHIKRNIEHESNQIRINMTNIELLHNQLQNLQNEKQKGVQIRSREKLILNEERPTKFFYIKEQQQQQRKTIQKLHKTENNQTIEITENKDILQEIHQFFTDVYAERFTDTAKQAEFLQHVDTQIDEQAKQTLDLPITQDELNLTIKNTGTNKSPGIDGLPVEFYETFWPTLKNELEEIVNLVYIHQQHLNTSQRTGIITLTHKKDEKENLENWRPITLLCADYKIITKTIATRLRRYLSQILHPNQTCSVPGREITTNLYLVRDIIKFAQYKDLDTFLISYDFKQAFDSIDHTYMLKTLRRYNFGPNFVNFIQNIYKNRTSMVMNNGYLTKRITINRGILQGCPISLPLFCIIAETLANKIRHNNRIQGINLPGCKETLKLTQYADDTNTITTKLQTITETFHELQKFGIATGCTLKDSKTKGLIITNKSTIELQEQLTQQNEAIKWNEDTGLKILGIHFFTDELHTQNYNWKNVISKLKKKTDMLKTRNLSLRGKVVLLNSVTLSKIWYLSSIIQMPSWAFKAIEKIIFKFLWGDTGNEPIKRQTLYLPIHKGGLGLLHPKHQSEALRLKFFFKIVDPQKTELWIFYARYWLSRRIVRHNPTEWNFLSDNTCAKYNGTDPPIYYRDMERLYILYKDRIQQLNVKPDTKQLYTIIMTETYGTYEIFAETIWNAAYKREIPWKRLWTQNFASYVTGKTHDVLFKLMHNCLPTKVRLKRNHHNRGNYSEKCKYCKKTENTLHIFARCRIAMKIWDTYRKTYETLLPGKRFIFEETAITLNLIDTNISQHTRKLALTLTNIIIHELWTSRNRFEKENTLPNVHRSVQTINTRMTNILETHYKHYSNKNDINTFQQLFTINNAICTIENGRLTTKLPEFIP